MATDGAIAQHAAKEMQQCPDSSNLSATGRKPDLRPGQWNLAKAGHRPAHEPARKLRREVYSVMEFAKFYYTIQLTNQLASWIV